MSSLLLQSHPRTSTMCVVPASQNSLEQELVPSEERKPIKTKQATVSFDTVQIREYPIILGDNPGGTEGPPLTLSWDYEEGKTIPVTEFEKAKASFYRQQYYFGKPEIEELDATTRRSILQRAGYTDEEIKQGEEEAEKVRRSRTRNAAKTPWTAAKCLAKWDRLLAGGKSKAKR